MHAGRDFEGRFIGFNVRADASARAGWSSPRRGPALLLDHLRRDRPGEAGRFTGLLGVEIREEIIGTAEVRDVFRSSKFGAVAGCMVVEGWSSATSRSACCATTP